MILVVAEMARSDPPMTSAFVAELARQLRGRSPVLTLALSWIEQRLSELSLTIEQMVQMETRAQAADQVSIGNSITSLRTLDGIDWRVFVERLSFVERALRSNPQDPYAAMDFATRDRYRHLVERLARHSPLSEEDVARRAMALAVDRRMQLGGADRQAHVGYFLIDRGLPELQQSIGYSPPTEERFRQIGRQAPLPLYLGGIALIAGFITALGGASAALASLPLAALALFVPVLLLAASQTAVSLVNWVAMLMAKPKILPRLDFDDGVPLECRTLVVVPTVISSFDDVDRLLELLEVRYLGNRDQQISFALLSDLLGRRERGHASRRGADRPRRVRHGGAQLPVRDRGAGAVLPPAPAPAVEPPGGEVHGVRAEARRDRGPEPAADRGKDRPLCRDRRRSRRSPGDALRDHPRRRHRAPAGRGTQADRDRRAPAQPAGGGSPPAARGRGLRRAPAPDRPDPDRLRPVVVRPGLRRRTRDRSVHEGGLGRLPGPLQGGVVHRKGALRPRGLRRDPRRTVPREPDPLPRPGRGSRTPGSPS